MKLRTLDAEELTRLYHEELIPTFPPSELKPLKSMLTLLEQGRYQVLGMFDGDILLGYALLWLKPEIPFALLDYFGILNGRRGAGLGSKMLNLLAEHCKGCKGLFCEAEEISSHDPHEAALQRRRLNFYARNGFRYGGYHCALFGVYYQTLIRGDEDVSPEELLDAHQRLYRSGIHPQAYKRFIQIPLPPGEPIHVFSDWVEE